MALQRQVILQRSAKEQTLGCVSSPQAARGGLEAESRNLGHIVLRNSVLIYDIAQLPVLILLGTQSKRNNKMSDLSFRLTALPEGRMWHFSRSSNRGQIRREGYSCTCWKVGNTRDGREGTTD